MNKTLLFERTITMTNHNHELLGLWLLKKRTHGIPGTEWLPAKGYLHYHRNNWMNVVIMADTESQMLLTSYSGPFHINEDRVVHKPLVGFSPSGLEEKTRYFQVSNHRQTLELSTIPRNSPPNINQHRLFFEKAHLANVGN